MTAIGPGDLLEAVEDYNDAGYSISRGRIYCAVEVAAADELKIGQRTHGPHCREGGVRVREAPTPTWAFWCMASFKPVGRPASAIISALSIGDRVAA